MMTLSKQRSVGFVYDQKQRPNVETINKQTKPDVNIKIDKLVSIKHSDKGVRKSDPHNKNLTHKDNVKVQKTNFSLKSSKSAKSDAKKSQQDKNRDDFLKATMRIFLVVSPPVGKMQVTKTYSIFQNFYFLLLLWG